VLLLVAVGLLIWVALSFVLAPLMGMVLRRCEVEERRYSAPFLRAKAQHPASRAA
jgi:hypothetical protein